MFLEERPVGARHAVLLANTAVAGRVQAAPLARAHADHRAAHRGRTAAADHALVDLAQQPEAVEEAQYIRRQLMRRQFM